MEKQLAILQKNFASFRQFQADQMEYRMNDLKDEIKGILAEHIPSTTNDSSPSTKRTRQAIQNLSDDSYSPESPPPTPQPKRLQTNTHQDTTGYSSSSSDKSRSNSRKASNRYLQLSYTDESDHENEPTTSSQDDDTEMKSTDAGGQQEQ